MKEKTVAMIMNINAGSANNAPKKKIAFPIIPKTGPTIEIWACLDLIIAIKLMIKPAAAMKKKKNATPSKVSVDPNESEIALLKIIGQDKPNRIALTKSKMAVHIFIFRCFMLLIPPKLLEF